MNKKLNHNLVKIHFSYTVTDISDLYGLHKNTVLNWLKSGLETIDNHKPAMIQGKSLKGFLKARNVKSKKKCEQNEIYCLKCRKPQKPKEQQVEFIPLNQQIGRLIGVCPDCNGSINRYCSQSNLASFEDCFNIISKGG